MNSLWVRHVELSSGQSIMWLVLGFVQQSQLALQEMDSALRGLRATVPASQVTRPDTVAHVLSSHA